MEEVTLLEVINRLPQRSDALIDQREATLAELLKMLEGHPDLDQIVLCGSGSSFNEILTARGFIEKMTKLQTIAVLPNTLLHDSYVIRPQSLYLFVSQSGTSTLTNEAALLVKQAGAPVAAMSAFRDSDLPQNCGTFIEQGVGKEEYGCVTFGFDTGVLTLMLMGLELGKRRGTVSEAEYEKQLADAHRISTNHRKVSDLAMAWFDRNKEALMATQTFTLYGGGALQGIAAEGALKILEVGKRNVSVGYEIDDGMHGPTMGYTPLNCVIALNDGGVNEEKCRSLVRWDKEVMHNGYLFGVDPLDDKDLAFTPVSGDWQALEFAAAVQVLAYRLAADKGVDLRDHSRHKEHQYFATHQTRPARS